MVNLILTLSAALLGGLLLRKLKIPAAGLIGSVVAVTVLNLFTPYVSFPSSLKFCVRIAVGVLVGSSICLEDIKSILKIKWSVLLVLVCLFASSIALGLMVYLTSDMDILTCLLATAPGGSQEMSLLAESVGADTSKVVALQLARIIITYTVLPPVINRICKKNGEARPQAAAHSSENKPGFTARDAGMMLLIYLVCAGAGWAFESLSVPGGSLVGSIICAVILSCAGIRIRTSKGLSFIILVMSGASLGSSITGAQILQLDTIIFPAILMLFVMVILNVLLGFLFKKTSGVDLVTAMYACAPGGLGDMVMIATDMGGVTANVAAVHMLRMFTAVILYPVIAMLLS